MGARYATREAVQGALDVASTARKRPQIDRALERASRGADGLCNRRGFWPVVATRYYPWPAAAFPTPGRIWLDDLGDDCLISLTSVASGDVTISTGSVLLEPVNSGPPFDRIELDRSTSASFGYGDTAQRDVAIAGVWGYDLNLEAAGSLAAAVATTSATTIDVTDSAAVGVWDLLTIGTERLTVTGKTLIDTGQTAGGSGLAASKSAETLAVSDGTAFAVDEVLTLDAERMRVEDVAGNNLIVKRAHDGSTLAAHTAGTTIYAPRRLTVDRGVYGTTAAAHSDAAAVYRHAYPGLLVALTIAEAVVQLEAEAGAYAQEQGAQESRRRIDAIGLPGLRDEVRAELGRSGRSRAV